MTMETKSTKRWAQIAVKTTPEAEDVISNLLIELGSGGNQIETDGLNKVVLIAYFPDDDLIGERVRAIETALRNMSSMGTDVGGWSITIKTVCEDEWAEAWKKFFSPLPVGKRILIYPSWEDVEDFRFTRDILIQIDPGMAFGTGKHPSTKLSLELIELSIKDGDIVADIGTGSGILAIASAKLGAKLILAVDRDLQSIEVAVQNCKINEVKDKVKLVCGDLLKPIKGKYDLIVSNISTPVLLSLIPESKKCLASEGRLILSGMTVYGRRFILNCLEREGFTLIKEIEQEGWVAIMAQMESTDLLR